MPDNKVSPVVAIAATSVTLFSLVGIGVLTGVIPSSYSQNAERAAVGTPPKRTEPQAAGNAQPPAEASTSRRRAPSACAECGTVTAIDVVERKGEGSGLGAIAGGVVGGVLGNQVGGGSGRKIATVAGAAGGALAGHEIEKRYKSERRYVVTVRMDDGSTRKIDQDAEPAYAVGDKVKLSDGRLTR